MHVGMNRLDGERDGGPGIGKSTRRRIDVTDMDADSLRRYVRECVDTDHVSLEHRGARTYLLVEK